MTDDIKMLRRAIKSLGFKLTTMHSDDQYRIIDAAKRPQRWGPNGETVLTLRQAWQALDTIQQNRCRNEQRIVTMSGIDPVLGVKGTPRIERGTC